MGVGLTQSVQERTQATVGLQDTQRDQLVLDHLPLVQHIARRIHCRLPSHVLLEDLVHAGILGLIDAVRRYDHSKHVRLKCYAKFRIRGAILDSLRQVDWSPRRLRRRARSLELATSNCRARLGREPTEPEVAAELHVSLGNLQRLRADLHGLEIERFRADANEPDTGEEGLHYRPGAEDEDPFCWTLRSEMTDLLARAIGSLPVRQREVLTLYSFEELTMKEVGTVLRIGESRVSQIHSSALLRLRMRLRELMERKQQTSG